MRSRKYSLPLILWIVTAILFHLVWGGGAQQVAHVIEERRELRRFAASVQHEVQVELKPMQISLLPSPAARLAKPKLEEPPEPPEPLSKPKPKPKPKLKPLNKPKSVEPDKVAEAPKPPEPVKKIHLFEEQNKPPPPKPPPELVLPPPKRAIAVKQHVKDDQPDNPNAEFIGDQANHVQEQTQAKITSNDEDHPNPTPGSSQSAPEPEPGNSDESRVASSTGTSDDADSKPPPPAPEVTAAQPAAPPSSPVAQPPGGGQKSQAPPPTAAQPPPPEQPPPGAPLQIAPGSEGSMAVGPAVKPRRRLPPPEPSKNRWNDWLGLGAGPRTPGGINLNLSQQDLVAVVGPQALQEDRRADVIRRRSRHAGSWKMVGLERWRAAIENYVPSAKPGNQTALNTARVPFATYLNGVHNRLHPIFADTFLASLDQLPPSHPLNREELHTFLELVLDKDDGRIVRMGVTHTSGVTAFDVNALEAVKQSSPFGKAPDAIVSPDGRVYVHWEFHRNRDWACSTYFARPILLKTSPAPGPVPLEPPPARPDSDAPAVVPTRHEPRGQRPAPRSL